MDSDKCKLCVHDGSQSRYPSGCTGCVIDERFPYKNFKARLKRYNPSTMNGIHGGMTEAEQGAFVRFEDVKGMISGYFKNGG